MATVRGSGLRVFLAPALLGVLTGAASAQDGSAPGSGGARGACPLPVAPESEIESVIREQLGYDVTAAPNEGRFMAELLLGLARRYRSRRPDGPAFRVRQEEFFPAFLRATGLDSAGVPRSLLMARRFDQSVVVEHRRSRVLEGEGAAGLRPELALAVRVSWPDTGGAPDSYTYEDTASDPSIRLRHERVVRYRLLDFDSVTVYDEMEGVSGRPTSGLLGSLFDVMGMVDFRESRYAVAPDGAQVAMVRAEKLLPLTAVATVTPDGRAGRGIPPDRDDLVPLRRRLQRPLGLEYVPWPADGCGG